MSLCVCLFVSLSVQQIEITKENSRNDEIFWVFSTLNIPIQMCTSFPVHMIGANYFGYFKAFWIYNFFSFRSLKATQRRIFICIVCQSTYRLHMLPLFCWIFSTNTSMELNLTNWSSLSSWLSHYALLCDVLLKPTLIICQKIFIMRLMGTSYLRLYKIVCIYAYIFIHSSRSFKFWHVSFAQYSNFRGQLSCESVNSVKVAKNFASA